MHIKRTFVLKYTRVQLFPGSLKTKENYLYRSENIFGVLSPRFTASPFTWKSVVVRLFTGTDIVGLIRKSAATNRFLLVGNNCLRRQ